MKKGENEIKIFFPSFDKFIKAKHARKPINVGTGATLLGFSYVRKAHYMSGWDWGPMLPDAGVWKDIYIIDDAEPRITDFIVSQRHDGKKVFLKAEVKLNTAADVSLNLTSPTGEETELVNGVETEIKNPSLWWPNGYGKQNLYTLTMRAEKGCRVTDEKVKRIGLRSLYISRDKDEWGEEFCFKINGVKIFAMGADCRDLCDIVYIKESGEQKLAMPWFSLAELLYDFIFSKFVKLYYRYRYSRSDNTLTMYILKNITAKIQKYYASIYNEFGYCALRVQVENGTQDGQITETEYYLANKKIYSKRFATDCFSDYFTEKALRSPVGIDDLIEYVTEKATIEELTAQHSYFITELNNRKEAENEKE